MKKQPKKRNTNPKPISDPDDAGPGDWTPLFAAFREAFDWALDVAHQIARDFPEEVEAVERVRTFMRRRIAGEAAHICIDDVMFTFALIIGAIERDLGPVATLGPWFSPAMRLPSATDLSRAYFPKHLVWSLGLAPSLHATA